MTRIARMGREKGAEMGCAGLVYYGGKQRHFAEYRMIERGGRKGMVEVTLREIVQTGRGPARTWAWAERARVVERDSVVRFPEREGKG